MLKCDELAIIEELLRYLVANSGKPSYAFGKAGANPALTWLDSHGRPSNKVGIPFGLNNGKLKDVWVGNELLAGYDIGIYSHEGDETNLTLLKQLTVPATARTKVFTLADIGDVSVSKDVQIAARIISVVSTNPRNIGIHATLTGTT